MARERWSGNTVFILAAIGSALGLGGIWRFPFKCYDYGGGAFVLAFLVANFVAGIPILILEYALGNQFQRGAPSAFARANRKLEFVGWWCILVGFVIMCYYMVVMGWCIDYFGFSFSHAWGDNPQQFFFQDFLGLTKNPWDLGGLRLAVVVGLVLAWILVLLCTWKGTTSVGKVVWVTVPLPLIILVVFAIRGVTLPGATEGLRHYVVPQWKELTNPSLWVAAFGQVFYMLSVGFGIMIAYASFMPQHTDLVRNAYIVGWVNILFSLVAGVAVFSALGYYAYILDKPFDEVCKGGPGLAFYTYPIIIDHLPGAKFWGFLFFLMLVAIAVDSAFSLTEAVSAAVRDKWHWSHRKANFVIILVGFPVGLLFCTGGGLLWLDIADKFIEFYGLCLVCLGEAVVLGLGYGPEQMRSYINSCTGMKIGRWWTYSTFGVAPLTLAVIIVWETVNLVQKPYENYPQSALAIAGWGLSVLLPVLAVVLSKIPGREEAPEALPSTSASRPQ